MGTTVRETGHGGLESDLGLSSPTNSLWSLFGPQYSILNGSCDSKRGKFAKFWMSGAGNGPYSMVWLFKIRSWMRSGSCGVSRPGNNSELLPCSQIGSTKLGFTLTAAFSKSLCLPLLPCEGRHSTEKKRGRSPSESEVKLDVVFRCSFVSSSA